MNGVQSWVRGSLSLSKSLLVAAFVLASICAPARAQNTGGIGQIFLTAPSLAGSGEHVSLCVANVTGIGSPTTPPASVTAAADPRSTGVTITVTLSLLNAVTGAVVSSTQVTVPPFGSTEAPPDPCLEFIVAPSTFAPASHSFIGEVMLNPQPLPPGISTCFAARLGADLPPDPCSKILTTSLQIFTPDANGNPTNVRVIAFTPPDPCIQAAGSNVCKVQLPIAQN